MPRRLITIPEAKIRDGIAWALANVPGVKPTCAFVRGIWHSICDRLAEWMMTAWTINFGWSLLSGKTFDNPSFAILQAWASIEAWTLFCLAGGTARLVLLIANGGWKKSPHFRVCAAFCTFWLWLAIAKGIELADTGSTGVGAYTIAALGELISMYRALKEAAWNDGKGPHQGNRG